MNDTSSATDLWYHRVRSVPDHPISGVDFADFQPVLANPRYFQLAINDLCAAVERLALAHHGRLPDVIVAPEARGFIFGTAVAANLNCGIILARKAGKLPPPILSRSYGTEYSRDSIEMQAVSTFPDSPPADGVFPSAVIIDDVIATGGTIAAVTALARIAGYSIMGAAFLLDVTPLHKVPNLPDWKAVTTWPRSL
jgi:adenine phosphoribosyltransferase